MAGMTWTPTYCQRSIIAAKGASDDGAPLGDLLCRQLVGIAGGSELLSVNFEGERVAEPLKAWVRHSYLISGYYQAIHAAATTAAILVARSYSPRIKYTPPRKGARRSEVASLANLRTGLDQDPAHAANVAARRNARELNLLSWLCDARNVAVQHSAERGFTTQGVVQKDYGLLVRRDPVNVSADVLRKARDLYRGLAKRHPEWREVPNDDREALDYLDMGSHELIETDPAGFDSARRIVHEAEAYPLVFTVPVAENVDRCFGAVLELRA